MPHCGVQTSQSEPHPARKRSQSRRHARGIAHRTPRSRR
jgi:hypothetical protein